MRRGWWCFEGEGEGGGDSDSDENTFKENLKRFMRSNTMAGLINFYCLRPSPLVSWNKLESSIPWPIEHGHGKRQDDINLEQNQQSPEAKLGTSQMDSESSPPNGNPNTRKALSLNFHSSIQRIQKIQEPTPKNNPEFFPNPSHSNPAAKPRVLPSSQHCLLPKYPTSSPQSLTSNPQPDEWGRCRVLVLVLVGGTVGRWFPRGGREGLRPIRRKRGMCFWKLFAVGGMLCREAENENVSF